MSLTLDTLCHDCGVDMKELLTNGGFNSFVRYTATKLDKPVMWTVQGRYLVHATVGLWVGLFYNDEMATNLICNYAHDLAGDKPDLTLWRALLRNNHSAYTVVAKGAEGWLT